ncbi:phosphotransferase family protein [Streptacidiphilus sp. EB103A]|uniref:phosphotransferase family protein n=1 Tax=Streptacidiphilus sp. EB103A TaxID=3156275 RepID=UPI0035131E85
MWNDEYEVLQYVSKSSPHLADLSPQPLRPARQPGAGIEEEPLVLLFIEGDTLDAVYPRGSALPSPLLDEIVGIFAAMAKVQEVDLPRVPSDWPSGDDSSAFIRRLATFAQRDVEPLVREKLHPLLERLGLPEHALQRFVDRIPRLKRRPFCLLHTDLHRGNLVVGPQDRVSVIDWEFAMTGDPIYDISTHMVRMGYPASQFDSVIGSWKASLDAARPGLTEGIRADLPIYLAYERAQSIYPDILRAASSLGALIEEGVFARAVARIESALQRAAAPLQLERTPDRRQIATALREWHRSRVGGS